jgi:hypothetical protein
MTQGEEKKATWVLNQIDIALGPPSYKNATKEKNKKQTIKGRQLIGQIVNFGCGFGTFTLLLSYYSPRQ